MGSTCCQSDSCSTFFYPGGFWPVPAPKGWCFPSQQAAHPYTVISYAYAKIPFWPYAQTPLFPLSASLSSEHNTLSEPHAGLCLFTAVTTQQLSPCFPFNGTFLLCFTLSHLLPLGWSALHTSGVRCDTISLLGLISEMFFCWYLNTHS